MPAVSFLYYKRCVCVAVRQTEEFVQLNFTAPLCGLYVKRPLLFKRNVKTYRVCIFSASVRVRVAPMYCRSLRVKHNCKGIHPNFVRQF